jgi:hypothetical protein
MFEHIYMLTLIWTLHLTCIYQNIRWLPQKYIDVVYKETKNDFMVSYKIKKEKTNNPMNKVEQFIWKKEQAKSKVDR